MILLGDIGYPYPARSQRPQPGEGRWHLRGAGGEQPPGWCSGQRSHWQERAPGQRRRWRQRVNPGRRGAAGGVAGLCSAAWVDAARQRREAIAAATADRDQVLDPVVSELAHDLSVLGLLLPTQQSAAPFRSRAAGLAWLQAWRDNPDSHPAALVAGPGGTGKTRLVTQFAITRPPPWAAGWLHPGRGASALAAVRACGDPALILIDDADASPDAATLLADLAGQP
jgi:hypothetical protein